MARDGIEWTAYYRANAVLLPVPKLIGDHQGTCCYSRTPMLRAPEAGCTGQCIRALATARTLGGELDR